jgi:hypothetical protein
MDLDPSNADLAAPSKKDSTAPEGLEFHFAPDAKPLATPWQVAVERAKLVRKCSLPKGLILDPACGSGIQLAAYCAMMGREGLGIELDEPTARAAQANFLRVSKHGFDSSLLSSIIRVGDGRIGDGSKPIAMLHLDPARPRNSRLHGLDEMTPKLPEIFEAWAPHLSEGEHGPAILLDLSPRLNQEQRDRVEAMVEDVWPEIGKTWVWMSRGRGRIDRLSLWLGQLSNPAVSRRFIRIPPDIKAKPIIVEGQGTPLPMTKRRPPRKGDQISLLDAALVESGLADEWLEQVLPGQEVVWSVAEGRRPQIHHPEEFEFASKAQNLLVQATGKIVKLAHTDLSEDKISLLVEAAREYGFGKLTLRVSLNPSLQPRLQGTLDRMLSARGGPRSGFVAKTPGDSMLLLCLVA